MIPRPEIFIIRLFILASLSMAGQADSSMVLVKEGNYVPLYGTADKQPVKVQAFLLDKYPVTNQQFLDYVNQHPEYTRSKIKGIFAEKNYLYYWKDDNDYGDNLSNAPVTNVSWFVAKNYCECQGKRLPTMDEWEYVAMADDKSPDARKKEDYNKYILSWYEKPKSFLIPVGSTFKNYWGIYDMHGLIWEWTYDFNSIFLSGESRKDKDSDKLLFCGSGSVNASDLMNYAAFMRYAFRGSMKANFTSRNLGFRCAKDTSSSNSMSINIK